MRTLLATLLICASAGPVLAQGRAGPGPAPGPWQQAYPDLYYNYGGIRLPFTVPGGSKGPGTINAAGFYLNGVSITSVPVTATNMPAFSGDCSSAAGTTMLTCTKTQGNPFAPSATTDTTNAGNIGSGTLPAGRLPAPAAATRGGIFSATAPSNQFQTGVDTTGASTFAQPVFANLGGVLLSTQVPAFTGDFTCSGLTCSLATVNASPGSYGGASSVPTFTVTGKGLLTAAGATAVVAPAGTLSGTTLAANVVNTSITSVGTIATGVWNGTAIGPTYIVTGTSGAAIGLLNANKTDSGSNSYTGANVHYNTETFAGNTFIQNAPTGYAGILGLYSNDGVRRGYLGYGDGAGANNILLTGDGGWSLKIVSPTITNGVASASPATSDSSLKLATTANVDAKIAAVAATNTPNFPSFANLKITNGATPNSQVTITADKINLTGTSVGMLVASVSATCSTGTSGANGLDTGTVAASTWYYVYDINNGTTNACLLSTSATSPTLPSGYTFKARVGAAKTDGSSNFYRFVQYGRRVHYVITPSTNTAGWPIVANVSQGSTTAAAGLVAVAPTAAGGFWPPTSYGVFLILGTNSGSSTSSCAAPSNNFSACTGSVNATTSPPIPPLVNLTSGGYTGPEMVLETSSVYVATQSQAFVFAEGYEDNL